MSKWFVVLIVIFSGNGPTDIAKVNSLKRSAEQAYTSGDFQNAINNYRYLLDSLAVEEDEIFLNLGHAYYKANDTANAKNYYARATMASDREVKSIAYQQLGVMHKSPQSLQESLKYLKASLKSNPGNTQARYDYEVVKKLLDNQQQNEQNQQEDQQEKDQEEKDEEQQQDEQKNKNEEGEEEQEQQQQQEQSEQQNQDGEQQDESEEQQEQEGEQENQEMSTKEKLEEMNISEDKARMILEAMKNGEIQYLQQQKRKATQRPDNGKPDW